MPSRFVTTAAFCLLLKTGAAAKVTSSCTDRAKMHALSRRRSTSSRLAVKWSSNFFSWTKRVTEIAAFVAFIATTPNSADMVGSTDAHASALVLE